LILIAKKEICILQKKIKTDCKNIFKLQNSDPCEEEEKEDVGDHTLEGNNAL